MVLFPCSFDSTKWGHWCSNERNWLIALNSFILVSGVMLAAPAISLVSITRYNHDDPVSADNSVYNTWIALSIMGCFQVLVAAVGIFAADKVSLNLMVIYFWMAALVIGSMFMWSISALEFQYSFKTWIKHHWGDQAMTKVREIFCVNETASAECAVPMAGFPYGSPNLWCIELYGSEDCTAIKDEAVKEATNLVLLWMTVAGTISLSSLVEMIASLVLTVRVVTVPIIMRSMQSTINYLMLFPVVGTIVIGYVQSQYSPMYKFDKLVELHYVLGAILFVVSVVGVIAGHLRHRRLLQMYMFGLSMVLLLYLVFVSFAFMAWARLSNGLEEDRRINIACKVNAYDCCCCEESPDIDLDLYLVPSCPEWSDPKELADTGIVYIKLGAMTSILSVAFVLCGLMASVVLHNNLKGYQSDYV